MSCFYLVGPENTAEEGPLDHTMSNEEINLASYILRKGKAKIVFQMKWSNAYFPQNLKW